MGRDRLPRIGILGDDPRSEARGGCENSMIASQVESGGWHQCREPRHEIEGLERDVRGSISPSVLDRVEHPAVGQEGQTLGGNGWACNLSAQALTSNMRALGTP